MPSCGSRRRDLGGPFYRDYLAFDREPLQAVGVEARVLPLSSKNDHFQGRLVYRRSVALEGAAGNKI
jgi:hypothetical protein